MKNRRGFLSAAIAAMATAAVGAELDLDRLLWVPGAKKIFIPKQLWIPDCTTCKYNIIQNLARDLTRITEHMVKLPEWVHTDSKQYVGHLFTKNELDLTRQQDLGRISAY